MTWGEFKKQMEEAEVEDSQEIWYFDISFPSSDQQLDIVVDDACGVSVS